MEDPAAKTHSPTTAPEEVLPAIDFATFILSLSTSAMVHLEGGTEPSGPRQDLALAKQTIDILGILEEKTSGNLDEGEARLLREILYDLRLRYCRARRGDC